MSPLSRSTGSTRICCDPATLPAASGLPLVGDVAQRPLEGVPEGCCQAQRVVVTQRLTGAHLP